MDDAEHSESKSEDTWQVRVKANLNQILDDFISKGTYTSKSEFIRQAVMEKLKSYGVNISDELVRIKTEETTAKELEKGKAEESQPAEQH